jgi:hypothetical protein
LEKKMYFVIPYISEGYSRHDLEKGVYYLRLSYSGVLKTRNTHKQRAWGHPAIAFEWEMAT